MQFDINRMSATPKSTSFCECCNGKIISKCGKHNIWHWAHESKVDCDDWYEPMTEWHKKWQDYVRKEYREIFVKDHGERHRADIKLPSGRVIEIQHSTMEEDVVSEREDFYGDMIWVFDGVNLFEKINRYEKTSKKGNVYVSWYYSYRPKKFFEFLTKPFYIDYGDKILRINQNFEDGTYFEIMEDEKFFRDSSYMKKTFKGWGTYMSHAQVKQELFGAYQSTEEPKNENA